MQELAASLGPWPIVVVGVVAAIALPAAASRQLTPDVLRESFVVHRPGRVVAMASVLLVVLAATGVVVALVATAYAFLWAIVASIVSAIVVVVVYLVRYRAAARAFAAEGIPEADDHPRRAGA